MSLHISRARRSDLDEIIDAEDAAMKDFGPAQALAFHRPKGQTRKYFMGAHLKRGFRVNDSDVWMKITDVQSGVLIAAAHWTFHDAPLLSELQPSAANVDSSSFMAIFSEDTKRFKREFIGTKAHAVLSLIFAIPNHRRKGAATMLVDWGCQEADRRGVVCMLFASPEAVTLYSKHGFDIVEEQTIDLNPWGVNETTIRRGMIRRVGQGLGRLAEGV